MFFTNSTVEFVPRIVGALNRIGCPVTLALTERALRVVLGNEVPTAEVVSARVERLDDKHEELLDELDQAYFSSGDDIATALFNYIQQRRREITFD